MSPIRLWKLADGNCSRHSCLIAAKRHDPKQLPFSAFKLRRTQHGLRYNLASVRNCADLPLLMAIYYDRRQKNRSLSIYYQKNIVELHEIALRATCLNAQSLQWKVLLKGVMIFCLIPRFSKINLRDLKATYSHKGSKRQQSLL